MVCFLQAFRGLSFWCSTPTAAGRKPQGVSVPTDWTQAASVIFSVWEWGVDFRCQPNSLPFTFPSIGHVTEQVEHDHREQRKNPDALFSEWLRFKIFPKVQFHHCLKILQFTEPLHFCCCFVVIVLVMMNMCNICVYIEDPCFLFFKLTVEGTTM